MLKQFYSKSASSDFWVKEFFGPVAKIRQKKIFKPRAKYINKLINNDKKLVIGDIGAGFGLFIDELRALQPGHRYIAIEPSSEMDGICKKKRIETKCMFLEDIEGMEDNFDLLTAFELVEHLFDPVSFFKKANSLLRPGGYLILTMLNGKGFDILTLWDKSNSVMPPHHLNFFNPSSLMTLAKQTGFEFEDISTPGKLDWDIVEGMIINDGVDCGKFFNLLAAEGTKQAKKQLQSWIIRNNLSSHMRIVVNKTL